MTPDVGRFGLIMSGELPPARVVDAFAEVSLVRGEYVLRRSGHYVTTDIGRAALRDYLRALCHVFSPKPVWYRLSDFESREIGTLVGTDAFLDEENPILGPRGTRRALLFPDAFRSEVACVDDVRREWPNLRFLTSYVGAADELEQLVEILVRAGLPTPEGCMVETPAAVRHAARIRKTGVSRLVLGLNDLATLLLGAHRGDVYHRRDHHLVHEAVAEVVDPGRGQTIAANAVDRAHGEHLLAMGVDLVALHYLDVPGWFGSAFGDLPDLDVVPGIKRTTALLLAES